MAHVVHMNNSPRHTTRAANTMTILIIRFCAWTYLFPDMESMQAVLGTKKMAEAFDKLSPREARKRLRKMCEKMDVNSDLVISKDELTRWIEKKFVHVVTSCSFSGLRLQHEIIGSGRGR